MGVGRAEWEVATLSPLVRQETPEPEPEPVTGTGVNRNRLNRIRDS